MGFMCDSIAISPWIHALTIDVEDYYCVIARDRLGMDLAPDEAVVRTTERLLDLFAQHNLKATFFVLGEVARTYPELVRRIARDGHEVGIHGFYHRQVFKLTPEQFRREIAEGQKVIEDAAGVRVRGHRAPAFSIGPQTQWALEVLAELGIEYDSSIFPFAGRRYGWPDFGPDIRRLALPNGATLIEAPMSTVRILGKTLPACGGGYLRHFPYAFTGWAMRRIQRRRPAIVYLHPYEVDIQPGPEWFRQAMAKAPAGVRRFHRLQMRNRPGVMGKLRRLLESFQFAPLGEVIDLARAQSPSR